MPSRASACTRATPRRSCVRHRRAWVAGALGEAVDTRWIRDASILGPSLASAAMSLRSCETLLVGGSSSEQQLGRTAGRVVPVADKQVATDGALDSVLLLGASGSSGSRNSTSSRRSPPRPPPEAVEGHLQVIGLAVARRLGFEEQLQHPTAQEREPVSEFLQQRLPGVRGPRVRRRLLQQVTQRLVQAQARRTSDLAQPYFLGELLRARQPPGDRGLGFKAAQPVPGARLCTCASCRPNAVCRRQVPVSKPAAPVCR